MCLAFDIVSGYHVPPLHFLTPDRDSMPAAYVDEIQLLLPIANIYNALTNHPTVLQ